MTIIRCLDVETTGFDLAVHRVCEIACVDVMVTPLPAEREVDNKGWADVERGEMWSSLVNPGHEIPSQASAVHDITDDMVKDAPMLPDLYPRIKAGPPDYFCAHNSRFDERFVKVGPWLDTYRIALWLWPHAPEHKLATLRYWLKLKLSDYLVEDIDNSTWPTTTRRGCHIAMWDAYVCAAVLRRAFTAGAAIQQMGGVSRPPAPLPR